MTEEVKEESKIEPLQTPITQLAIVTQRSLPADTSINPRSPLKMRRMMSTEPPSPQNRSNSDQNEDFMQENIDRFAREAAK